MKPFPKTPGFLGPNAPSRIEADVYDLEVEGEIPPEIAGTWYRVGPDHQYTPFADAGYFINGDGYVSMFRIGDGHVDLKSRFVRTDRFVAERKARKALFGLYRNAHLDDASVAGLRRGTANTTMIWHGGRLMAHKEDSRPMEIDPDTLATIGEHDWGGELRTRTVTAHPKIDPVTGEMLFFGYEAEGDGSTSIAYCVADRDGNLTSEQWFEPPYAGFVHDFAVTEKYVVFPIFPVIMDPERLKAGGPHWMWDASKDAHIGVMPRGGSVDDLRWFRRPACHAFHIINSFDDAGGGGDKVVVDLLVSGRVSFAFIEDVSGAPLDPMQMIPTPTRWTFDMRGNGEDFDQQVILRTIGELPRIDDRLAGRDYRYAWMPSFDPALMAPGSKGMAFNALMQLDVRDGTRQTFDVGPAGAFEEAQFIPRASAAGTEDGYLLTVVQHLDVNLSELLVFDTARFADGPIARAKIPFRMKMATHTCWVDSRELVQQVPETARNANATY